MGDEAHHSTLWSVSREVLGDPRKWPYVYEECEKVVGADPRAITPGHDLGVCLKGPVQNKPGKFVKVKTKVKKGDCLWSISRQLTGNGENWKEIVKENKELFTTEEKTPSGYTIQPGWMLTVPVFAPPC
eukprot:TRINITY_DN2845_c0_g2_i2.p2 TRINITY_DN2845_c0_g2~~TRINITY_DN2845_c0_g2_i2.p2  ORF type:complete len:129 (-),score=25.06 TRINITY_DN2845_c0_g2_i2:46-432(-)